MCPFDPIVEALVRSMAGPRREGLDWLGITAQFAGDHHARFAIGGDQTGEMTLCGFGVAAGLT